MFALVRLLLGGFYFKIDRFNGETNYCLRHKKHPRANVLQVKRTSWGWLINGSCRQEVVLDWDDYRKAHNWEQREDGRWVGPLSA